MKKSSFQFSEPKLVNINFKINSEFIANNRTAKIKINFKVDKKVDLDNRKAKIVLMCEIGDDKDTPFYISAAEEAVFKWEDELSEDNELLNNLLNQNAPALLVSYIRPVIANVTNSSLCGAYNIPYINFVIDKDNN